MTAPRIEPGRPILTAVLVGLGIGLVGLLVAFAILAIPWFALARFAEPGQGLDRPAIRDGLFRIALPIGVLIGTGTGVVVGRWYRRGGRLPANYRQE